MSENLPGHQKFGPDDGQFRQDRKDLKVAGDRADAMDARSDASEVLSTEHTVQIERNREDVRAVKKRLPTLTVLMLIATFISLIAGTAGIVLGARVHNVADVQHDAQVSSCERGNVFRAGARGIAARQAKLLDLIIGKRTKELALAATPVERRQLKAYLDSLHQLRSQASYSPLVNCVEATRHPKTYVSPKPRLLTRWEIERFIRAAR